MSSVPMPPGTQIPKRKRKSNPSDLLGVAFAFVGILAGFLLIVAAAAGLWILLASRPNPAMADLEPSWQLVNAAGETLQDKPLVGDNQQLWLPVDFVQETLGIHVTLEEDRAIITTSDRVIDLFADTQAARVNGEPLELRTFLHREADGIYLPADLIAALHPLEMLIDREHLRVYLLDPQAHFTAGRLTPGRFPQGSWADLAGRTLAILPFVSVPATGTSTEERIEIRLEPSFRAPILAHADPETLVWIIREEAPGWLRVRTGEGMEGFVPQTVVRMEGQLPVREFPAWQSASILPEATLPPATEWEGRKPGEPLTGQRLVVVWEQVERNTPNPETIGDLPGVRVLAPTWFVLENGEGHFLSKADARYVAWAHARDIRVWGTATNAFDPDLTREALATRQRRQTMIEQLLSYASLYQLDGINLDFENVHFEDRDRLTQFVREFTPLAHEQGLTVSIDVTMISTSPNWSMVYDRKAYGEIVDYVALMAYDEHWASSPEAGSVASLPWVENGLRAVLAEVPAGKLLLGVPLYTRIWRETADGVRSVAVTMERALEIAREHGAEIVWDENSQQNYFEYEENGVRHRVWLEDETSMEARMAIVHKYNLAGVAAWRRGYETDTVWPMVQEAMSRWP